MIPWKVVIALSLLGVVCSAYERVLVPIYASAPTYRHLNHVSAFSVLAGSSISLKVPLWIKLLACSVLLALAPLETYWVAALSARLHRPILGTTVTHLVVLFPLGFCITNAILNVQHSKLNVSSLLKSLVICAFAYPALPQLTAVLRLALPQSDTTISHSLAATLYLFGSCQMPAFVQPSKNRSRKVPSHLLHFAAIVFFWPIHRLLSSPVLHHPITSPYRKEGSPLVVLSAVDSVTGLILVGEILQTSPEQGLDDSMHSVRFLRADHSLLGGMWTGPKVMTLADSPPVRDALGNPLGDSIYATFHLQEAVLLAEERRMDHGLIIGLGTGISASAFLRRNVSLDLVEIDPAVYEAAKTFFGLPDSGPGTVHLEDARAWLSQYVSDPHHEKFDFVVHDCFSGGGVPDHLYTTEFWEIVKTSLESNGLVVINYAGYFLSASSRMIHNTLMQSFAECRGFHDQFSPELDSSQYETEFINIVWICAQSKPLTFRSARSSDYLGSPLRRHVLHALSKREVPSHLLAAPESNANHVLTDKANPLGELQRAQGSHHWQVMREVMPDDIWEIF